MKISFTKAFLLITILGLIVLLPNKRVLSQVNDTANVAYWIEMMQDPDANFFQVQKAFETYWKGKEITKGSGYKPFKRWEYMMQQRVSLDGKRPEADRELKALQKMNLTRDTQNQNGEWTALGPFTVPSGYNGYRGLGRVNAIAFHPTNPDILYIGAPAGGLWVSYNHGESWDVLTDHLPTLGVSSIIVNSSNPDIIYIGTGDRDAGDAPGLGIWRSINGGIDWEQWSTGIGNATVGRMIQHPTNPEIMLAATSTGLYRTTNSGVSWVSSSSGNYKEVVFKPNDPEVVFAAKGGTFYRSTNNGINFTSISNGLPGGSRGVIGVSAANPEIVYFLIANSDSFKGIYRSADAGLSFELRSNSPNIMSWDCNGGSGGQGWYDLDIAVDPDNADIVLGGGVNSFKSINGGTNWTIRSHWYGGCGVQSVHADLHILEYNPINKRLYVGNDGGFYWTQNGGVNWQELSNGLVISQAYKIGQSATKRDYVINGYQDNGTSALNGTNWVTAGGGDGMECAYDPTNENYSYTTVYYGDINRNYNNNSQGQIAGEGSNGITEGGAWVTPFLIDHNDGNVMFIGYKNVWRSTNIKASSTGSVQWTKISTINTSNLSVLAQSRANTSVLYAASGNKLYLTQNAKDESVIWNSITASLPTSSTITSVETHPTNENIVYIAQQTRIFKSENKGQSWTEITKNLSNIQINSIAYYKNSSEGLYLGTDLGVFYTDATITDWVSFSNGMPYSAKVTEVEIYYDPTGPAGDVIRAGTYGRGLWSSPPYFGSLTANFESSTTNVSAGCGVNFTDLSVGTPHTWLWTFEGGSPATSTQQNPIGIIFEVPGVYSVSLTITNPLNSSTYTCSSCMNVGPASVPDIAFEASSTTGCAGTPIQLTDMTQNCPTSWLWSFSPSSVSFVSGTSALSQHPVVQFNENVNYTITLAATNNSGTNVLTKTDYIQLGGVMAPFNQNFNVQDLNAINWVVENPDNNRSWELKAVNENRNVMWMNFFNYTSFSERDYLISPALNLSEMQNAYLSFEYAYAQRYFQVDSLIISISTDCGNSWTRIYANGPDGQGIFETSEPTIASFLPSQDSDWCIAGSYGASCPVIDISQYAGMAGIKLRFESFNKYGNNLYLDNVMVSQVTGTNEHQFTDDALFIYPNPATSEVNIIFSEELRGSNLIIMDTKGSVVSTIQIRSSTVTIDVESLTKGVYFIKTTGKNPITRKLIVY